MKFFNFFYRTALHTAINLQNIELVKLFVERKDTDVNIKSILKEKILISFPKYYSNTISNNLKNLI